VGFFLEGCSGFLVSFGGLLDWGAFEVGLGVFEEGFDMGFNCFFGIWVSCEFWMLCAFWLEGFDGPFCCFLDSGFVRALLYTAYVYRGVLRFSN
jgi:hypothetical protein